MADSSQIAVIRWFYDARGNPDIIRQVLARDIRWEVVEGFPYGGVYVGLDDVLGNFFGRLFRDFESFVAAGAEFFESGDHVIALEAYTGRAKATGKDFSARFAHVWTLQGGKIVRLQQCADTIQFSRALAA
jgi:ketosteroid isomerase-like protein